MVVKSIVNYLYVKKKKKFVEMIFFDLLFFIYDRMFVSN